LYSKYPPPAGSHVYALSDARKASITGGRQ